MVFPQMLSAFNDHFNDLFNDQLAGDRVCIVAASVSAATGAVFDLKSARIPNLLTGGSLLAGLALHLCRGGAAELGASALAGLLAGAAFLLFYVAGGMGAGDVKLMAAVGCIAGLSPLRMILFATVISGALFGVAMAAYHRRLKQTVANALVLISHHWRCGLEPHPGPNVLEPDQSRPPGLKLPFALPIAAGCLIAMLAQIRNG
jgi:prepilin peptidase CpaA